MKITYLHQYFNTPAMSGGTRSFEMARRLVKMGHEVNLVTAWRDPVDSKNIFETTESGINVYWIPVPYFNAMGFWNRCLAFIQFAFRSAKLSASIPSDIIFATSTPLTIAIPAVYASFFQKVPMVFEVRDLWPELPIAIGLLKNPFLIKIARLLESWAYRNSSAIVALSPGMKQGIARRGYPSNQIVVIPNSSVNTHFKACALAPKQLSVNIDCPFDQPLLLYAGSFGLINGVSYAVSLAEELKLINSNVRILLVGGGLEYNKVYSEALKRRVLNRNLFIEPRVSKKDVVQLFLRASVCATLFLDIPEMRNNSANKFFDTLAAGKPVFVNYGGWMNDIVLRYNCGISGWRTPLCQVATQIDSCLNDEKWLERAGSASKEVAKLYFDVDKHASSLNKTLMNVLAGNFDVSSFSFDKV